MLPTIYRVINFQIFNAPPQRDATLSSHDLLGSEFHKLDYVVWLILIRQTVYAVAYAVVSKISF